MFCNVNYKATKTVVVGKTDLGFKIIQHLWTILGFKGLGFEFDRIRVEDKFDCFPNSPNSGENEWFWHLKTYYKTALFWSIHLNIFLSMSPKASNTEHIRKLLKRLDKPPTQLEEFSSCFMRKWWCLEMSILSRVLRVLGILVFGMSVWMSLSIWNGFGIN